MNKLALALKSNELSFEEVNTTALEHLEEILESLSGLEYQQVGNEFQMLNPKRNDTNFGSFKINSETGLWADHAVEDAKGGDVISLVAYLTDSTQSKAKNALIKFLCLEPTIKTKTKSKELTNEVCVLPIPESFVKEVLNRKYHHPWNDVPVTKFTPYQYKNKDGEVNSFILRYDLADGRKEVRPYSCWLNEGQPSMKFASMEKNYTLYNLDQLVARPNAPVLVTEGEKSANAASILFPDNVVVTTMFGAKNPLSSDLTPLIGRDIYFWPDHDEPGLNYVKIIAEYLYSKDQNMTFKFLDLSKESLPNGWDAADALKEKVNISQFNFKVMELKSKAVTTKENRPESVNRFINTYFPGEGLRFCDKTFYGYTDGYWSIQDPISDIRRRMAEIGGESANSKFIDMTFSLVRDFTAVTKLETPNNQHLICLANGTLDTNTYELLPHSKDHGLMTKSNIEWNPSSTCINWINFLEDIFANDEDMDSKISFIQEWFGYCLTPDTSQEKFVWMIGEGANGKSTLLDVLTSLVGKANTSSVSLERMGDRFARMGIRNKLVNISSEMSANNTLPDSYLKQITSGELIEAEYKGKDPVSFNPYVKLISATNTLPRLLDHSKGFARRGIILSFNKNIAEENQNKMIGTILAKELPGILSWAVKGLKNLRARGKFMPPESAKENMETYRKESNPVAMFVEECLLSVDSNCHGILASKIYARYRTYCSENGYTPASNISFFLKLKGVVGEGKKRKTNGVMIWSFILNENNL